ncbi:MAG: hypothetical protein JRI95_06525, partial [Deltaproteobacteria bacterium]|nr:hypothetical protein [Deltaproteobacteria bacterium]
MTKKSRNTTRREFLKTSGKIAGTVIFSGLSAGSMSAVLKPKTSDAKDVSPPEGRGDYKVFSAGQIGTMSVKNRLVRSATMIAAAARG